MLGQVTYLNIYCVFFVIKSLKFLLFGLENHFLHKCKKKNLKNRAERKLMDKYQNIIKNSQCNGFSQKLMQTIFDRNTN